MNTMQVKLPAMGRVSKRLKTKNGNIETNKKSTSLEFKFSISMVIGVLFLPLSLLSA